MLIVRRLYGWSYAETEQFVGDSLVDLATARNAGMTFVGVTWGLVPRADLVRGGVVHLAERAADLARKFRAGGLQVLIGGFHVSGMLALSQGITPEIQELIDLGVTVVKGEVEDTWGDILRDALEENLKSVYDFLDRKPDLYSRPIPMILASPVRR